MPADRTRRTKRWVRTRFTRRSGPRPSLQRSLAARRALRRSLAARSPAHAPDSRQPRRRIARPPCTEHPIYRACSSNVLQRNTHSCQSRHRTHSLDVTIGRRRSCQMAVSASPRFAFAFAVVRASAVEDRRDFAVGLLAGADRRLRTLGGARYTCIRIVFSKVGFEVRAALATHDSHPRARKSVVRSGSPAVRRRAVRSLRSDRSRSNDVPSLVPCRSAVCRACHVREFRRVGGNGGGADIRRWRRHRRHRDAEYCDAPHDRPAGDGR